MTAGTFRIDRWHSLDRRHSSPPPGPDARPCPHARPDRAPDQAPCRGPPDRSRARRSGPVSYGDVLPAPAVKRRWLAHTAGAAAEGLLEGAHSGPRRERRPPPGKVRFRRARRRPPARSTEPSPDSFAAMEPGRASPARRLSPATRPRVELACPRQAALVPPGPPAPAPRHFRDCRVRRESPPAAEHPSPAARVDRRWKRNPWPGYAPEG